MILFLVIGAVAQTFIDWDKTMPAAALAGVVIAMLVPDQKASCAVTPAETNDEKTPSPAEPDPELKVEA